MARRMIVDVHEWRAQRTISWRSARWQIQHRRHCYSHFWRSHWHPKGYCALLLWQHSRLSGSKGKLKRMLIVDRRTWSLWTWRAGSALATIPKWGRINIRSSTWCLRRHHSGVCRKSIIMFGVQWKLYTDIAITIVGGNAPFNIMRKDRESSPRRDFHVAGLNILRKISVALIYGEWEVTVLTLRA